jgi:hypothetical protein
MSDRAAFWRKLIARRRREELSVEQVCREAGVSPASFYAWQRRLRSAEQPELVPVHIVPEHGASDAAIEIELPEARRCAIQRYDQPCACNATIASTSAILS